MDGRINSNRSNLESYCINSYSIPHQGLMQDKKRRKERRRMIIHLVRLDMRPEVELQIIAGLQHLIATSFHNGDVSECAWGRHIFQSLSYESFPKVGLRREWKKRLVHGDHADSIEPRAIPIMI